VRILAIDPGPTTGFAYYADDWPKPCVGAWQVKLPKEDGHKRLWIILQGLKFEKLILERFEFRKDDQKRDKIDYTAAEYVGVCTLFARLEGIELILQGSAQVGASAFWADDNRKVRQLGLYNSKAAPHGMDGLRHLLYHLTFKMDRTEWFERLK
jgi:hypothetical protein